MKQKDSSGGYIWNKRCLFLLADYRNVLPFIASALIDAAVRGLGGGGCAAPYTHKEVRVSYLNASSERHS